MTRIGVVCGQCEGHHSRGTWKRPQTQTAWLEALKYLLVLVLVFEFS
jgi:hypothetical protein